jgi:hypothetical protein
MRATCIRARAITVVEMLVKSATWLFKGLLGAFFYTFCPAEGQKDLHVTDSTSV